MLFSGRRDAVVAPVPLDGKWLQLIARMQLRVKVLAGTFKYRWQGRLDGSVVHLALCTQLTRSKPGAQKSESSVVIH